MNTRDLDYSVLFGFLIVYAFLIIMASFRHCFDMLPLLLPLFLCYLVSAQTAGAPGPMPSAVGSNPGPPAIKGTVDPNQAGWYGIKQWTSLGDSYATGVGVGNSLAWNRCVHFSDAYPKLMTVDDRMPGKWGDQRILWDCTCSGATTQYVIPSHTS